MTAAQEQTCTEYKQNKTKTCAGQVVQPRGTERYAAPEVLLAGKANDTLTVDSAQVCCCGVL